MKKKTTMKYAIKYSDGCYYSRQPENDIDIVTSIADADTFANESTAIQIAKNETLGVTLFDENGVKHYYKTKPEVVPIKS